MRALIIGCGYIGKALGHALQLTGHEVFGLRRSPTASTTLKSFGIKPILADITNPATLAKLNPAYDWVINTVSSGGGTADDYRRVYLQGTKNLLEWLTPNPPQKFIYTSSTSVYAQNDGSWVTEDSPTEPEAETARILVETEGLLLAPSVLRSAGCLNPPQLELPQSAGQRRSVDIPGRSNSEQCRSAGVPTGSNLEFSGSVRQFPAIVLRLAGIYGPSRGYWFKQFLAGEARIEGDGSRYLNMVHREDVVGSILAALEKARPGSTYNVVDDEPVSQIDFFRFLAKHFNRPLPSTIPQDSAARKRGASNKRVSNARLKLELHYHFQYPSFREATCASEI